MGLVTLAPSNLVQSHVGRYGPLLCCRPRLLLHWWQLWFPLAATAWSVLLRPNQCSSLPRSRRKWWGARPWCGELDEEGPSSSSKPLQLRLGSCCSSFFSGTDLGVAHWWLWQLSFPPWHGRCPLFWPSSSEYIGACRGSFFFLWESCWRWQDSHLPCVTCTSTPLTFLPCWNEKKENMLVHWFVNSIRCNLPCTVKWYCEMIFK